MSAACFALVLRPDASFQAIEWPADSAAGLRSLYTEVDCTNIAVVDLSPKVSMWLDDEGILNGSPVNKWATTLYAATAPVHQNYWLCTCRKAAFLQQFGRHCGGRRRAVVHDDGQHHPSQVRRSAVCVAIGAHVARDKSAGYGVR
ncbi:hypothetical protein DIZ27_39375 [Streptomyces sp. NWU339]|uniref:DUF3846 domain-containing protein n=1 Tax=Streptomyces sp. NWU339 TaxID=2185284 RepID=UPI000D67F74E|nr:DUF3846 domain-containing protein [Streptomyces sp. NWU339]PWI05449.1 hypothetical protein DIZ27_39375 [Streptomyces sp. NWU339]